MFDLDDLLANNPDLGDENPDLFAPKKESRRREGGQKAKRAGDAFEAYLASYHEYLEREGLAVVHKTGPVVKWINAERVVPVAPGPCDYAGVLSNGVSVWFEAKSTSRKTAVTLPSKTRHQYNWLRRISPYAQVFYIIHWRGQEKIRLHWLHSLDEKRLRIKAADGVRLDVNFDYQGSKHIPFECDWYGCVMQSLGPSQR
jgi:penicillin-binding protein-related factor A (putative recombinase)